jgi:hypothetical protein
MRDLIFRMVAETPTWGAPRIHGELPMLGFDISERSVSRWMKRARRNPNLAKRWLVFLRVRDGIACRLPSRPARDNRSASEALAFKLAGEQGEGRGQDGAEHPAFTRGFKRRLISTPKATAMKRERRKAHS